jgi:CRISPR/Cas system-associated exonuclease Cas4 (RecB family)
MAESAVDLSALHKTSHSEVEAFLNCERRHYYGYGLEVVPIKESDALIRGNVGHAALANYYNLLKDGVPYQERVDSTLKLLVTECDRYTTSSKTDLLSELVFLLSHYFVHYRERDENLEVLAVEKEYLIPVGDNFYIKMYVDLIVRMPNVGVAAWDHKFVWNFYDPEQIDINPQLPKYVGAMRGDGYRVSAAFYNQVRYQNTKENTADPGKHFSFDRVELSPARVKRTIQEQIVAAHRIKELKDMPIEEWEQHVLRNPSACDRCPYKMICAEDLNGKDIGLTLAFSYKKKEPRDPNG